MVQSCGCDLPSPPRREPDIHDRPQGCQRPERPPTRRDDPARARVGRVRLTFGGDADDRFAHGLLDRDVGARGLDLVLDRLDKVRRARAVDHAVIEGQGQVARAANLRIGHGVVPSVVDLADEQCRHARRNHDRHRIPEAVVLHIGQRDRHRLARLVLAAPGDLDLGARLVGEFAPPERVAILDDGDHELVSGQRNRNAEIRVVVRAIGVVVGNRRPEN